MLSLEGRMSHLVFKDGTTVGGALAVGQTLRLGEFIMTACSAAALTMNSLVIENSLHVKSALIKQMDPMELSSLNELLDHIAALGVAMDYDQIGLKPDQREINSLPVTHHIAVVEEQGGDLSSILRTKYVWIPELSELDARSRGDNIQSLNLESGSRPGLSGHTPEPELSKLEIPRPLDPRSGRGLDSIPPTHPNTSDLSNIRQEPQETVHHYWARFLLAMNKVKDCREEDAILFFCNNCTDKGILNP